MALGVTDGKEETRRRRVEDAEVVFSVQDLLERMDDKLSRLQDRMDAEFLSLRNRIQNIERWEVRVADIVETVASLQRDVQTVKQDSFSRQLTDRQLATKEDIEQLVHRDEFDPVKRVVYGAIAVLGSALLLAMVGLLITAR